MRARVCWESSRRVRALRSVDDSRAIGSDRKVYLHLRQVCLPAHAYCPSDGASSAAFGMLVLGSPDPTRYSADMGTEFLMRIGEIASAGLARLLPAG